METSQDKKQCCCCCKNTNNNEEWLTDTPSDLRTALKGFLRTIEEIEEEVINKKMTYFRDGILESFLTKDNEDELIYYSLQMLNRSMLKYVDNDNGSYALKRYIHAKTSQPYEMKNLIESFTGNVWKLCNTPYCKDVSSAYLSNFKNIMIVYDYDQHVLKTSRLENFIETVNWLNSLIDNFDNE